MAQIPTVISVIKQQLKAHGKTYADVASALELSEASVKRLFAEQNFTLQRLEDICNLIDLELSDLMQLVNRQQRQLSQLTVEQEQEIASDIVLLLFTVYVINGCTFQDLRNRYTFTEAECIRKLVQLDRLKIIELLPNNRIKLLIAPNFTWLTNGPIQRFFQENIEKEFFKTKFTTKDEKLIVVNGLLSCDSIKELQKKMQRLADDFTALHREDNQLPLEEKPGTSMIIAQRQWNFNIFDKYRKN